jgi:ribosomal protein S2
VGNITIGGALERFLPGLLTDLDKSLEEVRRGKKKKGEHEQYCNKNDKKLQKLSLKYHPDQIRNNGGSEEEIAVAEEVQKALNAVCLVIKGMNEHFCKDIDVDYRYSFYAKKLGNEAELK